MQPLSWPQARKQQETYIQQQAARGLDDRNLSDGQVVKVISVFAKTTVSYIKESVEALPARTLRPFLEDAIDRVLDPPAASRKTATGCG